MPIPIECPICEAEFAISLPDKQVEKLHITCPNSYCAKSLEVFPAWDTLEDIVRPRKVLVKDRKK